MKKAIAYIRRNMIFKVITAVMACVFPIMFIGCFGDNIQILFNYI